MFRAVDPSMDGRSILPRVIDGKQSVGIATLSSPYVRYARLQSKDSVGDTSHSEPHSVITAIGSRIIRGVASCFCRGSTVISLDRLHLLARNVQEAVFGVLA